MSSTNFSPSLQNPSQRCAMFLRPGISPDEAARRVAQCVNSGEVAYVAARNFSDCTPSQRAGLVGHLIRTIRDLRECLYVDDTSILEELEPIETAIAPEALKQNLRQQSEALYFSGHQLLMELQRMQDEELTLTPQYSAAKRRQAEILHRFVELAAKQKALEDVEGILMILEYIERIQDPSTNDPEFWLASADIEKHLTDHSKVIKSLEKAEEIVNGELGNRKSTLAFKALCVARFADLKAQAGEKYRAIGKLTKANQLFLNSSRVAELVGSIKLAVQRKDPINPFNEAYQRVNKLAVVRYLCLAVESELAKNIADSHLGQPCQNSAHIHHFLEFAKRIAGEIMEPIDRQHAMAAIGETIPIYLAGLSYPNQLSFSFPSRHVASQEVIDVCLALGKSAIDAASDGSGREVLIVECIQRFVERYAFTNAELDKLVGMIVDVQIAIAEKSSASVALRLMHENYARLPETMYCRVIVPRMVDLAIRLGQGELALNLLAELHRGILAAANRLQVEGRGAAQLADIDKAKNVLSVIQLHVRIGKVDTLMPLCAIVEGILESQCDLQRNTEQAYREGQARVVRSQVAQGIGPETSIRTPVTLSGQRSSELDALFEGLAKVYEEIGNEVGLRRLIQIDPKQKVFMLICLGNLLQKGKNDVRLGHIIEEFSGSVCKLHLYRILVEIQADKGMVDEVCRSIKSAKQLLFDAMPGASVISSVLIRGHLLSSRTPDSPVEESRCLIFGQALLAFIAAYLKINNREAANALMRIITEELRGRGGYRILNASLLKIFVRVYCLLDRRDLIEQMITAIRKQKRGEVIETELVLALAEMHDLKGAEEVVNRMFAAPSETQTAKSSQSDARSVSHKVLYKAALLAQVVTRVFPQQ